MEKAFTTKWGENGPSVLPQLIQWKQMVAQAAMAFAAQKKRQIWAKAWALSKPPVSTRFIPKVKACLNAKFEVAERKGLKADPNQVSADTRNARDEENNRRFSREEWLTQNQIKSYFFRLASTKRKGQQTDDVDDRAGHFTRAAFVQKCPCFEGP